MVRAQYPGIPMGMKPASQPADRLFFVEQVLGGNGPPANDVVRIHNFDLGVEEFLTIGGFLRTWVTVSRRPASQDIADIDVFPLQSAGLNDFVQQLAGPANEWFSLLVLIRPGSLTNKHDPRVGISYPKHRLSSSFRQLSTTRAVGNAF